MFCSARLCGLSQGSPRVPCSEPRSALSCVCWACDFVCLGAELQGLQGCAAQRLWWGLPGAVHLHRAPGVCLPPPCPRERAFLPAASSLRLLCFLTWTNLLAFLSCFLGFQEISELSSYEVIIPQRLGRERREASNVSSVQVRGSIDPAGGWGRHLQGCFPACIVLL